MGVSVFAPGDTEYKGSGWTEKEAFSWETETYSCRHRKSPRTLGLIFLVWLGYLYFKEDEWEKIVQTPKE